MLFSVKPRRAARFVCPRLSCGRIINKPDRSACRGKLKTDARIANLRAIYPAEFHAALSVANNVNHLVRIGNSFVSSKNQRSVFVSRKELSIHGALRRKNTLYTHVQIHNDLITVLPLTAKPSISCAKFLLFAADYNIRALTPIGNAECDFKHLGTRGGKRKSYLTAIRICRIHRDFQRPSERSFCFNHTRLIIIYHDSAALSHNRNARDQAGPGCTDTSTTAVKCLVGEIIIASNQAAAAICCKR